MGAPGQIPVLVVMVVDEHSFGFSTSPIIRTYCKFSEGLGSEPASSEQAQSLPGNKVPVQKLF